MLSNNCFEAIVVSDDYPVFDSQKGLRTSIVLRNACINLDEPISIVRSYPGERWRMPHDDEFDAVGPQNKVRFRLH